MGIRITSGMKTMAAIDSPALLYLISVTNPLQGVANAFVYFRPQYRKFRERDHHELRLASAFRALQFTVPSILLWRAPWKQKRSKSATAMTGVSQNGETLKVLYADYRQAFHSNNDHLSTENDAENAENGITQLELELNKVGVRVCLVVSHEKVG